MVAAGKSEQFKGGLQTRFGGYTAARTPGIFYVCQKENVAVFVSENCVWATLTPFPLVVLSDVLLLGGCG